MTTIYLQRQIVSILKVVKLMEVNGSEVENESDPWEPLIEEAKERNVSEYEEIKQNFIERGLDEESICSELYSLILPKLQKDLERIHVERLFWMRQLRKNRVKSNEHER